MPSDPPRLRRRRAPLDVWIPGRPAPQGSMTPIRKGPRLGVRSANDAVLKPWRAQVAAVAGEARASTPLAGPVAATLTFVFRRPKSHYRTGRNAHELRADAAPAPMNRGQGDVDKLSRAVLDALTDAHVIVDDALVVRLTAVKQWAYGVDGAEGCRIILHHAALPEAV